MLTRGPEQLPRALGYTTPSTSGRALPELGTTWRAHRKPG
jgi:hypothetical protein